MAPEFVDDATFWPALPCQECETEEVPFCPDAGDQTFGACETHVASLLKRVLYQQEAIVWSYATAGTAAPGVHARVSARCEVARHVARVSRRC
jgi:hypothetical protein